MFHIEYIRQLLLISIVLSSITCTFIQKTKVLLPKRKYIIVYSFIVNIIIGILFCKTFTDLNIVDSIWIGLFTFLGANSIYKMLKGKILSYNEILIRKKSSKQ